MRADWISKLPCWGLQEQVRRMPFQLCRTVLCREVLSHQLRELHPWHLLRRRNSSKSSERLGNTILYRGAAIWVLFSCSVVTVLASSLWEAISASVGNSANCFLVKLGVLTSGDLKIHFVRKVGAYPQHGKDNSWQACIGTFVSLILEGHKNNLDNSSHLKVWQFWSQLNL